MNKTMKSIKDKTYIAIRRHYTKDFRKITISFIKSDAANCCHKEKRETNMIINIVAG